MSSLECLPRPSARQVPSSGCPSPIPAFLSAEWFTRLLLQAVSSLRVETWPVCRLSAPRTLQGSQHKHSPFGCRLEGVGMGYDVGFLSPHKELESWGPEKTPRPSWAGLLVADVIGMVFHFQRALRRGGRSGSVPGTLCSSLGASRRPEDFRVRPTAWLRGPTTVGSLPTLTNSPASGRCTSVPRLATGLCRLVSISPLQITNRCLHRNNTSL